MIYSKIAGTGGYLPKRVVTNKDLENLVDTSDEWITERTGIKQRHVMEDHETTSSMAEIAARQAINAANIDEIDVDLIIVGTCTPDRTFPSTACILQERLGVVGCPAFDVSAACSGFIYGLSIADMYIKSGQAKNALVIGAESLSRIVDWKDRTTCILFSDGAGAVVLQASETPGILSTHLHANGEYNKLLYAPNHIGELKEPPFIKMAGNDVFKLAVKYLGEIVDETLAKSNLDKSKIDWLIPHQANLRIIKATARKLELPMERVILTIENQGNTSAASVPLALNDAVREGKIKAGEILLLEAFGAGLTWGSALVKY